MLKQLILKRKQKILKWKQSTIRVMAAYYAKKVSEKPGLASYIYLMHFELTNWDELVERFGYWKTSEALLDINVKNKLYDIMQKEKEDKYPTAKVFEFREDWYEVVCPHCKTVFSFEIEFYEKPTIIQCNKCQQKFKGLYQ